MSDEEYTPTTEEVRREWAERRADGYSLVMGDSADNVALAEFDRWLVSVRRDEREKCAQIAESMFPPVPTDKTRGVAIRDFTGTTVAAAIRAQSEEANRG